MRTELLDLLQCPNCSSGELELIQKENNGSYIKNGEITCFSCGLKMGINGGILNSVFRLNPEAQDELEGHKIMLLRERNGLTDEWLLGLPDSYSIIYPDREWVDELADTQDLIKRISLSSGALILDLGAGTCWATNLLTQLGFRAIALDISTEKFVGLDSAEIFINYYGNYFERVLSDMGFELPFKSNSFDGVFCRSSIHHSHNIKKTIAEIKRVLKPKGKLGIIEASKGIFDKQKTFGQKEKCIYKINEHIYSYIEYKGMLRESGFEFTVYNVPSLWKKFDLFSQGKKPKIKLPLKHKIVSFAVRLFWKNSCIKRLIKKIISNYYVLLAYLFGLQVIIIAHKREDKIDKKT